MIMFHLTCFEKIITLKISLASREYKSKFKLLDKATRSLLRIKSIIISVSLETKTFGYSSQVIQTEAKESKYLIRFKI